MEVIDFLVVPDLIVAGFACALKAINDKAKTENAIRFFISVFQKIGLQLSF